MSGFTLDLPNTEVIKKEVAAELAPTAEEKTVITTLMELMLWSAARSAL